MESTPNKPKKEISYKKLICKLKTSLRNTNNLKLQMIQKLRKIVNTLNRINQNTIPKL